MLDSRILKRLFPHSGIRAKLIVCFSLLFAAVLIVVELTAIQGIPYTPHIGRIKQHRTETFQNLNLIADMKRDRLMRWLQEFRDDIATFSNMSFVRTRVTELQGIYSRCIDDGMKDSDIWKRIHAERSFLDLQDYLRSIEESHQAYDRIFIADIETERILVSTDGIDISIWLDHEDIFTGPLQSRSGYVSDIHIDRGSKQPVLNVSRGIETYDPEAAPEAGGRFTAVMVAEINSDKIIMPMLHTGDGLGETGEALLVNQDRKILTSLKHPLSDGTRANPLEYQIEAKPAMFAARGEEGIIESADYRGVPVLAAYRHIRISPGRGWGLVVKRDRAELYAPLRRDLTYSFIISAVGIAVVLLLTVLIAGSITRPIEHLSQMAEEVDSGNLAARADVASTDEVGQLARTFNRMVQHVQERSQELERRVRVRTADLNSANEQLRNEIAERSRAEEYARESEKRFRALFEQAGDPVFLNDPDGRIVDANEQACNALDYTREELLALTVPDICPLYSEEAFSHFFQSLAPGIPVTTSTIYRRKDGKTFPVEIRTGSLEIQGTPHSLSLARDITDRRKLEEQLRQAQRMETVGQLAGRHRTRFQ